MSEKVQEQSGALTRHQPVPLEACIQVEDVTHCAQTQAYDSVERETEDASEEKQGQNRKHD